MREIKEKTNKLNILKNRIFRSRWQNAVTAMACVVLFCTVYALILPAATAGKEDLGAGVGEERVIAQENVDASNSGSGSGSESSNGTPDSVSQGEDGSDDPQSGTGMQSGSGAASGSDETGTVPGTGSDNGSEIWSR